MEGAASTPEGVPTNKDIYNITVKTDMMTVLNFARRRTKIENFCEICAVVKHFWLRLHLIVRIAEEASGGGRSSLEELAAKCSGSDSAAQRQLFDALAPKMLSVCLRYAGDRMVAEDLLQDGFVTLFTHLDSYTGSGSFEGWARKIFVNTALMYLRKKDALKGSEDIAEARSLASGDSSAVEKIGYKELMKLIASLPADARTVFNMYVIEGYSHKEIAEALGITEATSRSKLQRARIRLQEMIVENG